VLNDRSIYPYNEVQLANVKGLFLMKPLEIGVLVLLGAIWGASYLFIRVAAPAFGPMVLMFSRVVLAGLVLLGYAAYLRQLPDYRHTWRKFLVLGLINSAIPFTLIAWSELTLNASLAAILNSTTPLFTALIAALIGKESLTWQKIAGVLLGIVGVAVLVGGSPLVLNKAVILAAFASLVAALFYGIGTVFASLSFHGMRPLHTSIGQLLGASVVMVIPATVSIPSEPPSWNAVWAFLALALLSTSVAYLLYFYLINHVGPTRTASVTFLVPIFGSIWGILFLNEPFSVGMLIGGAIILASVGLVLGARYRKPRVAVEPAQA
jgi:drug/metabolite transporter (DMT)-like permease